MKVILENIRILPGVEASNFLLQIIPNAQFLPELAVAWFEYYTQLMCPSQFSTVIGPPFSKLITTPPLESTTEIGLRLCFTD